MESLTGKTIFEDRQLRRIESTFMEKEFHGPKPNRVRQADNLSRLHGHYWHGVYYRDGIPQLSKERRPFPSQGTIIFNMLRQKER